MSIETFCSEVDTLHAAIGALRSSIAEGAQPSEVTVCMADLATNLADLFEHENSRIYGRLDCLVSGIPITNSILQQATRLHDDWMAYLTDWPADCIAADRETFAIETDALLRQIEQCSHRASNDLYPIALAKGLIRLRA